ncbi:MAG TPA: rhomboid family intramembrane serine protease, partial [Flavobacterium sp.]|nr:rhomboid family intramembrane serine protease [Flavobacterium sp.]
LMEAIGFGSFLQQWFALSSGPEIVLYKPWTLLTYAFLHFQFLHLLFNMLVLNFAGRLFLTFFTQKQFLGLYLLSGIFSGIIFVAAYYLLGLSASIVGASGAIMAILVATATYSPYMNLRLLLIGNVKLWHFTAVVLILDLLYLFAENTGGHIAHLAGAFFGFLYIRLLQSGTDLSKGISFIFDSAANLFTRKKATPFKKVHRNTPKPEKVASKIVNKDKTQQQIDEILDKISQSGYDSLTKDEKEFLFKAGK